MSSRQKISFKQQEILISFMEEHRALALGQLVKDARGRAKAKSLWEELARQLNAVGRGATKTPEKWRDFWTERKYQVRRRARARFHKPRGTDDDPTGDSVWTTRDERVMNILGKKSIQSARIHGHASAEFDSTPGCSSHEDLIVEPDMSLLPPSGSPTSPLSPAATQHILPTSPPPHSEEVFVSPPPPQQNSMHRLSHPHQQSHRARTVLPSASHRALELEHRIAAEECRAANEELVEERWETFRQNQLNFNNKLLELMGSLVTAVNKLVDNKGDSGGQNQNH